MVSDEEGFDEIPMDDDNLEQAEVKQPIKKGKPVARQPVQNAPGQRTTRYVAVHQSQMDGIIDTFDDNKTIAVDIWDMLARIYNKLEAIERAVGV